MRPGVFEHLLAADRPDRGCEACFEILDQYAEAVLRGEDTTSRFSGVITHLRQCDACREDTEGLLAALRTDIFETHT